MCKDLGNNIFQCNGNCAGGTVWGTGIYTADSNMYAAAKHMGYLPGTFTKIMGPGLQGYKGTSLNEVTTCDYGQYPNSYYLHKGVFKGEQNKLINQQVNKLRNQIAQLASIEQNLKNIINLHQKSVKNLEQQANGKEEYLKKLEKTASQLAKRQEEKKPQQSNFKDFEIKMKDLYAAEMHKYNQNIFKMLNQKDYLPCTVCSENKRQAMLMPCNHAHFCKDCLKKSLQQGKCNTCRQQIKGYLYIII